MKPVETASGRWLVELEDSSPKFNTEQDALDFILAQGLNDGGEEEEVEEESSEEEAGTYEQEIVFGGKSFGKEKI